MDTEKSSIHTLRHEALATAVRVLIELQMLETMGEPCSAASYQRMQDEVAKWNGTNDTYALGIMAPLSALS